LTDDFTQQLTPELFASYTKAVRDLGRRQQVFDGDEALLAMTAHAPVRHVGDVVQVLDYLVETGTIEPLAPELAHGPTRWRYVE
jgi:hypothetical protein